MLGEGRRRKKIYGGAFVPGEPTTRDKRSFCPGWWLHPGQKSPLLSQVKPPHGIKGPFVLGRGFTRDKRGGLLSRVNPRPGTKGPFVPGRGFTRDKRPPLLSRVVDSPGTKGVLGGPGKFPARGPPLVPGGSTTRDKRARFPAFPPNLMFVFVSFLLLF